MNRLCDFFEEDSELEYGDFFVVAGDFGAACVARETGASSARKREEEQDPRPWEE